MMLRRSAGELVPQLASHQRRLLQLGGIGALTCVGGLLLAPARFFQAYLVAYVLIVSLVLGSLALGMLHQLSGGAWGVVIGRLLGAAARTLPVVTVAFLPILAGMRWLYPWTDAALVASDEVLAAKRPYLNVPFFIARAALCFAVWNVLAYWLTRWAQDQDRSADPRVARRMQRLSAGGLVAYGLTISFASFDWMMSLEPHWFSTMFGVLTMAAQGLMALAFAIVGLAWLARRAPLDSVVTPGHFHDLGNLLLAFVMLWAYLAFSQYLIIWSGNLPEEVTWYQSRTQGAWRPVAIALIGLHVVAPCVVLLSRALKRSPERLAAVAAWMVALRCVETFWIVAPAFHPEAIALHWLDLLLPLALGLLWLGWFVRLLRQRPLLPLHDPEIAEAIGATAVRAEAQEGMS